MRDIIALIDKIESNLQSTTLASCPRCGGNSLTFETVLSLNKDKNPTKALKCECKSCGCSSGWHGPHEQKVVKFWNMISQSRYILQLCNELRMLNNNLISNKIELESIYKNYEVECLNAYCRGIEDARKGDIQ